MRDKGWIVGLAVGLVVTVAAFAWAVQPEATPKGAGTTAGYVAETPAAAEPVSLWIGDSYTAGNEAGTVAQGEACQTASLLRWQCVTDAEGGTGFVADGRVNSATFRPLIDRLPATIARHPAVNLIVIDAGRNDAVEPEAATARMTAPGGIHPTAAGARFAAQHLAAQIRGTRVVADAAVTAGSRRR